MQSSFREQCLQLFHNEDIQRDVRLFMKPIFSIVYNELFPYLLLMCIFQAFLLILVLGNMFLLVKFYISLTGKAIPDPALTKAL